MEVVFITFAVIAIVAAIIVAGILAAAAAKKRREAIAAWARANGFSYFPGEDRGMAARYAYFDSLSSGSNRYAYNIVRGDVGGLPFCMFDFHYETHSTDSKGRRQTHHHHLTAVVIETGLAFPAELKVRPEGFFDKLASVVGFDDIDFESDEFSRKFHVKSNDKKFAYDVIHPRMMEYLLQHPSGSFEIERNAIGVAGGSCLPAEQWKTYLSYTRNILDMLPEYLIEQLKTPRDR